jgi:hypothetical protein
VTGSAVVEASDLKAGEPVPSFLRGSLASALMSALMVADCGGAISFWTQSDHFRIDTLPACRVLRGNPSVRRIAGVSPFDDPVGAWLAMRAACAAGPSVALVTNAAEPLLLACPAKVPDLPIQQILHLRPSLGTWAGPLRRHHPCDLVGGGGVVVNRDYLAPAGAIGRWLARVAPEVVSGTVSAARALPSPRVPPACVCPLLRGHFGSLGTDTSSPSRRRDQHSECRLVVTSRWCPQKADVAVSSRLRAEAIEGRGRESVPRVAVPGTSARLRASRRSSCSLLEPPAARSVEPYR